jgi:hypothetical protein
MLESRSPPIVAKKQRRNQRLDNVTAEIVKLNRYFCGLILKEFYKIELPSGATYNATLNVEAARTVEGLSECVQIVPSQIGPLPSDLPYLNE